MSESLLSNLITLSKIDAAMARIFAEKKATETALSNKEAELKKALADKASKQKIAEDRRKKYNAEDVFIKDEQAKIVERKKALNTLHSYKLQQAATREIDYNSRQLKVREDGLLKLLEEAEQAEKALTASTEKLEALQKELEAARKDSAESLVLLEKRRSERAAEREAVLPSVLPAILQQYDRIKSRFPVDPMVAVSNNSCSGCHIQVAAQLMVQIHKGDSMVRCRGCGRILYLDPATASQANAGAQASAGEGKRSKGESPAAAK